MLNHQYNCPMNNGSRVEESKAHHNERSRVKFEVFGRTTIEKKGGEKKGWVGRIVKPVSRLEKGYFMTGNRTWVAVRDKTQ
jgi:hypothetical protein